MANDFIIGITTTIVGSKIKQILKTHFYLVHPTGNTTLTSARLISIMPLSLRSGKSGGL